MYYPGRAAWLVLNNYPGRGPAAHLKQTVNINKSILHDNGQSVLFVK